MNDKKDLSGNESMASQPSAAASIRTAKAVTVSVPASVAKDLEKMQRVTKSILGKLGCLGCHSGFDIRFILETQFSVDEKLNINAGKQLS